MMKVSARFFLWKYFTLGSGVSDWKIPFALVTYLDHEKLALAKYLFGLLIINNLYQKMECHR
jgi:hypothetical protein